MPYLTGDDPGEAIDCRLLGIPDEIYFRAALSGAIAELTRPENWEKFGDLEPTEAAALAQNMWLAFADGLCVLPDGGDVELIAEYPLQTATVSGIALTDIPDTYQALMILISARTDRAEDWDEIELAFQSDTGNQYAWSNLWWDYEYLQVTQDDNFSDDKIIIGSASGDGGASEIMGFNRIWIYNYASEVDRKPVVHEGHGYGDLSSLQDLDKVEGMAIWNRAGFKVEELNFQPAIGANFTRAGIQVFGVG